MGLYFWSPKSASDVKIDKLGTGWLIAKKDNHGKSYFKLLKSKLFVDFHTLTTPPAPISTPPTPLFPCRGFYDEQKYTTIGF